MKNIFITDNEDKKNERLLCRRILQSGILLRKVE